jgi:hypothetical protein
MPLGPQGAFLFTGALPQAPRLPALVLLRCELTTFFCIGAKVPASGGRLMATWSPLATDAALSTFIRSRKKVAISACFKPVFTDINDNQGERSGDINRFYTKFSSRKTHLNTEPWIIP